MIQVVLNELLQQRNMSQRELARQTGRHPDVVSRFARQATEMVSYDLLDSICEVLDCDVGDLLRFTRAPDEQILLFGDGGKATAAAPQPQRTLRRVAEPRPQYADPAPTEHGQSE